MAEINEFETKNYAKNQWNKNVSLKDKIDKSLTNMKKWRKRRNQANKIRDEIKHITTNTDVVLRIIR
jgi:hypothetical protein